MRGQVKKKNKQTNNETEIDIKEEKEAYRRCLNIAELEQQHPTVDFLMESKKSISKEKAGSVLW